MKIILKLKSFVGLGIGLTGVITGMIIGITLKQITPWNNILQVLISVIGVIGQISYNNKKHDTRICHKCEHYHTYYLIRPNKCEKCGAEM